MEVKCDDSERCQRLRTRNPDKGRPIIFRLIDYETKVQILKNSLKLNGSLVSISEDFSLGVRENRRKLWKHSVNPMKNCSKARLHYDSLIMDNNRYNGTMPKKIHCKDNQTSRHQQFQ